MGKKGKIGKQRRDKFYHLAKEIGYRSRAAFKLLQLNRKFEFLQRSKVVIDLCAAPGGWLQVAHKYMPVSSVIIGVDLFPIKPIHNVITLQEDITTQKCRSSLKKHLQTWKADLVLHDGAPNVGKSWIHDAFEQNRLTLSALHLACDFLIKGGWFVTKVFRSKDYNSLLWVMNKLFRKVFTTKPLASRNESAEIFMVCQNYISPDKIDPKFFDPSYVFAELEENEGKISINDLLKATTNKKKVKAEGYEDGEITLYHKLNASEFIENPNYAGLLSKASEIVLDTDFIRNHPSTTNEIIECIQDIKVLGKKELMLLINWRKNLYTELKKIKDQEQFKKLKELEDSEVMNENIEDIDTLEKEEILKMKKKKKKISKERRKLIERMNLKMVLENDQLVQEEQDLFNLQKIKKKLQIDQINDVEPDMICDDEPNDDENGKIRKIFYDKDSDERYLDPDDSGVSDFSDADNSQNEDQNDQEHSNYDLQSNDKDENELLPELGNSTTYLRIFDHPIFQEFASDDDEPIIKQENKNNDIKKENLKNRIQNNEFKELDYLKDSKIEKDYSDSDEEINENEISKQKGKKILSKEELALGSILIKSRKVKEDLIDDAWNRYMHEDNDTVPSWFRHEEQVYCRKPLPVSKEYIKQFNKPLNSKPIKKVLEAKARKKKRILRRLNKARLKAESLTEDPSMSNKEKADSIRRIYKKASVTQDKRPKLVIAKKQYGNRRPPGVKGRYKIVDPRMKKDKRKSQNNKISKNKNKRQKTK